MIEITVSRQLPCDRHQIYLALQAWERFSEWWPVPVAYKPEQAIVITPLPFFHIRMIRDCDEPDRRLCYRYTEGPFRGEGVWHIDPSLDDPALVNVKYVIRLEPINPVITLLASTPFFRLKHQWDINRILDRLCSRATLPPTP